LERDAFQPGDLAGLRFALYVRNSVLGLKTLLVNDPEGVRHVLTGNAANYRRPPVVTRFARPLGGSGLFWRRR
jgi:hypothetical protein